MLLQIVKQKKRIYEKISVDFSNWNVFVASQRI